jgi:hypothetical protein
MDNLTWKRARLNWEGFEPKLLQMIANASAPWDQRNKREWKIELLSVREIFSRYKPVIDGHPTRKEIVTLLFSITHELQKEILIYANAYAEMTAFGNYFDATTVERQRILQALGVQSREKLEAYMPTHYRAVRAAVARVACLQTVQSLLQEKLFALL